MTQHRQRQRLLLLLCAAVHLARLVKFSFLSHLLWPVAIGGLGLEGNGDVIVTVLVWPLLLMHYYRVKCDKSVCAGGGCLFTLHNWLDKPAGAAAVACSGATYACVRS